MTRILIIRLSAIGDVVHTLPAVPLLKKHLPGCHITWVVEQTAADLLRGYDGIDELLVSHRKDWLRLLRSGSLAAAIAQAGAFIRLLRRDTYDLVLDFQGLFKSAVLAGLSRGKRTIGFANARELAPLLYTERAAAPDFNDQAIRRHMGILRHLDIPDGPHAFSPFWGADEERRVDELLAGQAAEEPGPLVVMHPRAAWPTKCWNDACLAAAADRLQQQHAARIVFIGAETDRDHTAGVISRMTGRALDLSGRTTLRELACLFARAALVLAMDSGPLHLACAAGAPVAALFGPTAPWRTGPFGSRHQVIRKELACSPCYKKRSCPLGHHRCMAAITVEEVIEVCGEYLR